VKVLILDGDENQAVACVRSLSRAGHSVYVGSSMRSWKAGWSRYCHGRFLYPPPERDAESFVRRVCEEVRNSGGALVLPMTERTMLPLSACRGELIAAGARFVLPSHDIVLKTFDKFQTTRLAQELAVAVPHTVMTEGYTSPDELIPSLRFPVVLKPRASWELNAAGAILATGRPLYARNGEEFRTALRELQQRSNSILIQEFVEGQGVGYFALMRHGELRAEFAHQRIRDVRPTGSGSAYRRSVLPDPRVREAGLAILRALRWHGAAMVEFRLPSDGVPVFLEVNGRFWNSLALAVYSGIDFPVLLARMAEQGDLLPSGNYRVGVHCRWLLGDFRHLVEVWRGAPRAFPGRFPRRLQTLWDFLRPVPGTYHDNFEWRDPLPELGDWLDFVLRKLPEHGRTSRIVSASYAQSRYSHS
jgi:predicted ATP-grasp superfamily ATP-dependent carboligase